MVSTPLKHTRQLGSLFPIDGKNKTHVPNHQAVFLATPDSKHQSSTFHTTNHRSMGIPGTDLLEVATISKAYVSGPCFSEYPHKIWPNVWHYRTNPSFGSWNIDPNHPFQGNPPFFMVESWWNPPLLMVKPPLNQIEHVIFYPNRCRLCICNFIIYIYIYIHII